VTSPSTATPCAVLNNYIFGFAHRETASNDSFEFGLDCLLNGIALRFGNEAIPPDWRTGIPAPELDPAGRSTRRNDLQVAADAAGEKQHQLGGGCGNLTVTVSGCGHAGTLAAHAPVVIWWAGRS
jgi:hypothetical protein